MCQFFKLIRSLFSRKKSLKTNSLVVLITETRPDYIEIHPRGQLVIPSSGLNHATSMPEGVLGIRLVYLPPSADTFTETMYS
ncbi:hypothetical protein JTE90_026676 [Oedothorax gibbosus]|uniref:Uncharacterized protein n=1 Tax=Oedothorax gibbosus TaxID=931172 RepID=A0AAV6TTQ3_9ARAC|nr:hypothetical protein JTE90_026676 [Oedothorax gibbosus]